MHIRSPRTILALSAVVALSAAALAPTAAFAKGPGPGDGSCGADCPNDQAQLQQRAQAQDGTGGQVLQRARARDGSAQQAATQARAGGGQQVQARAAGGGNVARNRAATNDRGRNAVQKNNRNANRNANRTAAAAAGAGQGLGRGPDGEWQQDPGECPQCTAEMGTLTPEQEIGLVYMANEEKMAHDVYAAFAEKYGLRTFERIADSEARHQLAVRTVLERYGIEDTTADLLAGEFSDPAIAELYEKLMEQGLLSLEDALAAAVLIEQTDIADLEQYLTGLEEEMAPDVFQLYSQLQTASGYHRAAFESQL